MFLDGQFHVGVAGTGTGARVLLLQGARMVTNFKFNLAGFHFLRFRSLISSSVDVIVNCNPIACFSHAFAFELACIL